MRNFLHAITLPFSSELECNGKPGAQWTSESQNGFVFRGKPSSPFFNGCKIQKSLFYSWSSCLENSHRFLSSNKIKCTKNLSTQGGGGHVGFLLFHFFFFKSQNLQGPHPALSLEPHTTIPGAAELKGTFLETGPPAFPRGDGSGKGGGAGPGTWLPGPSSGFGAAGLPSAEFSPPRPLPFNPSPRQLQNPGAD